MEWYFMGSLYRSELKILNYFRYISHHDGGSMTMTIGSSHQGFIAGEGDQPQVRSDLQEKMKQLSTEQHRAAEGKAFLQHLCGSHQVNKKAYGQYLTDLLPVYRVLEEMLMNHRELPFLAPICIPECFRANKIEKDLKSFNTEGIEQSPASIAYQMHLKEVGEKKPHLLIPHVYARYLGDLAGGQIIKKHVQQIWPDKDAVAFYDFSEWSALHPDIKSPYGLLGLYRKILNGLPLTDRQYQEVLEEVESPFTFAIEMLDAIERIPGWDRLAG